MPDAPDDSPLADSAARWEFVHSLNENFCVSAGAGVGKTRAIVDRIAQLAERRGEAPDVLQRLVVVTYGILAAEELRLKARNLILTRLGSTSHGRQQLLRDFRGAFFGTIHSFCLKVIGEHGRHLGLPAKALLLAGREEENLWARFCDCAALEAVEFPEGMLARVSRHVTFEQLLDLAREVDPGEIEGLAEAGTCEPPPALDMSRALADDGGRHPKARATTQAHQAALRRWLAEYENAGSGGMLKFPSFQGGAGTFLHAVEEGLRPYALWVNAAASCLAARIARAWLAYRSERGFMTYRDQVFWCRRLIAIPEVLRRLRERGYVVILDEAQDTDAEMFSILSEITRPVNAPVGDWPTAPGALGPVAGRFCFVGDEQQSIYGERADPAIYRRYVNAFREGRGGRRLEFSVTMRCPRRVIAAVNAIFSGGRLTQPHVEFRALAERPNCPEGRVLRLDLGTAECTGDDDGDKLNSKDCLARECRQIAEFISRRGQAGLNITRWGEVAILSPRIDWLETAAAIFSERALPAHLVSQKRMAREQPRHSWPAALLHVLVNPWDRFELIGVLREIFAVSDVDLARLHGAGELRFWHALPPGLARAPARLRHAIELLHELRAAIPGGEAALEQGTDTIGRYLDMVLERTALADRLKIIGEPAGALDLLRVQALNAECEGVPLRRWVAGLVDALEQPPASQPEASGAIQLLTCMKAKGLEWPVVILLGAGYRIRERPPDYPLIEREAPGARPYMHFSKLTREPERIAARERRLREEYQRMLYVGLTRARRTLVIPDGSLLHGNGTPSFLQLAQWKELEIDRHFPTESQAFREAGAGDTAAAPSLDAAAPGEPITEAEDRAFREDRGLLRRAAAISARIPRRILPSGLVHVAETPAPDADAVPHEEERAFTTTTGGMDYGTLWHGILEHYPWAARPERREDYLRRELAALDPASPLAIRVAEELSRLCASQIHADLLAEGAAFLPEVPFSYPRDPEAWIEGIMDLVATTRTGGVWIIDWKTDRLFVDETPESLLSRIAEKYGKQLEAYAEVLERGFKRPVTRCLLYSTALGDVAEVRAPGLVLAPAG